LFLGTRRVERKPSATWAASHRLLMNRAVDAIVVENGAGTILGDGLAYDRCQVGVVTDLGRVDELDNHDIQTEDQLFKVLRTQVDVVLSDGVAVLNADEARVAEMAELSDGEVILYALDAGNAALTEHRGKEGRGVFLRGGAAMLAQGTSETSGANVESLQARFRAVGQEIAADAVLAAVATGWAMGISPELISAGLDTFVPDLPQ
jgi:cyanophycin synthetase